MRSVREPREEHEALDLGEYCRRVEQHLTRVNGGQIIRVAGPAFDLVRRWAAQGIPLPIVYRGIEAKAERHRAGRSKRPLRLEFCEHDVQALFEDWRRAVGLWTSVDEPAAGAGESSGERRGPSVGRQLDRAMERLTAAAGHLDRPEAFRECVTGILTAVADLRERLRSTRGEARRAMASRLVDLDNAIAGAARLAESALVLRADQEAAAELAPFRGRLAPEAWQRSVEAAADRLLRASCGLPVLDPAWIDPSGNTRRG